MSKTLIAAIAVCLVGTVFGDWLSVGPDGGRLEAGTVDPHNPGVIYTAPYTSGGQYTHVEKSTDGGVTWHSGSTIQYCSYPYALMVDPYHDSLVYVVASGNRFYRSTDHGETFVYTTMPMYTYYGATDPEIPGRVYVIGYNATIPRHPAFSRSDDYGMTWSPMVIIDSTIENQYGYSVAGDSGFVYAGASRGGLYRSTDGGTTWEQANAGITPTTANVKAFRIDPDDKAVGLTATSGGIFRTTNAGDTWIKTGSVMAYYMAFSPVDPDLGFAGYNRLYRTTDRGLTWSQPSPGLYLRFLRGFGFSESTADTCYGWGSSGFYRSDDRGANWTSSHDGMRIGSVTSLSVSPSNPDRIYADMDDVQMFYTTDCGTSWDTCGYFLSCGNICDIAVAGGADTDILYALEGSG